MVREVNAKAVLETARRVLRVECEALEETFDLGGAVGDGAQH